MDELKPMSTQMSTTTSLDPDENGEAVDQREYRSMIGVTLSFKAKTRCSSYVCVGSSCHTYGQNVNIENQCLKYINFITRILSLHRKLYRHSHRAATEQANPTGNRPGAMHASRRSLYHRSSSHLRLLSSVTARVSRLIVVT
jgi:hypothetical protein